MALILLYFLKGRNRNVNLKMVRKIRFTCNEDGDTVMYS